MEDGVDYKVTDAWTVGRTGTAASGQFLFRDEANLTAKTSAYFVLNLQTSYEITRNLQLLALLENAFNTTYYTSGSFSPTSSPGATNTRSYSPPVPIAGTVGIGITFWTARFAHGLRRAHRRGVGWAGSRRRVAPAHSRPDDPAHSRPDGFRLYPMGLLFGGFPDGDRIGGLAMDCVVAHSQLRLLHAQRHKD